MTKCPRCGGTMGKNYEQGLKDERKRIQKIIKDLDVFHCSKCKENLMQRIKEKNEKY